MEPNSLGTENVAGYSRRSEHFVFSGAPILVYWEITQACDLACHHCRAEANPKRNPLELNFSEGIELLEQIRVFGTPKPHLVLTGGDPLKRADLFDLIECARELGIRVSIAPSATVRLSRDVFTRFLSLGVESIALSLDGSTPEIHDGLRGVPGCFAWTFQAAREASKIGLPLQVNTLVTAETIGDLPAIYGVLPQFRPMRWKLFHLIAVGRGRTLNEITPDQCEGLHQWLSDRSKESPFAIATTEAPHYRRIALSRARGEGIPLKKILNAPLGKGFGIRDGNGILFVSHHGDVYPSGFLPLSAGNVRTQNIVDIYRNSRQFQNIRTVDLLKGRCGACEYRTICGGSRARAYAHYGDYLAEDPACNYQPKNRRVSENIPFSH